MTASHGTPLYAWSNSWLHPILLKYRPLFQFLHRHAPKVAEEVQRAYVVSARAYYETCFRRYARSLGLVKVSNRRMFAEKPCRRLTVSATQARSTEMRDLIGAPTISDAAQTLLSGRLPGRTESSTNGAELKTPAMKAEEKLDRLKFAKIDEEPVILGFQAENKAFVRSIWTESNMPNHNSYHPAPTDTTFRSGLSVATLGAPRQRLIRVHVPGQVLCCDARPA